MRVGTHPLVSDWVLGHKVKNLLVKLRVPPWDLPTILVAIAEQDYEPLRQVDMEH